MSFCLTVFSMIQFFGLRLFDATTRINAVAFCFTLHLPAIVLHKPRDRLLQRSSIGITIVLILWPFLMLWHFWIGLHSVCREGMINVILSVRLYWGRSVFFSYQRSLARIDYTLDDHCYNGVSGSLLCGYAALRILHCGILCRSHSSGKTLVLLLWRFSSSQSALWGINSLPFDFFLV